MSLTQGGGQLPPASVVPAFQGDVTQMTNFANSLGGQTVNPGAFNPSQGMMSAANLGNNYFGAGNPGSLGIGQLSKILSGGNLNSSSNPYLQSTIGSMQSGFQQALGSGQDMLNAQFNRSGQSPDSGANANASTQLARGGLQDFSNSLGNLLFGQYNQGENQITSALGDLGGPLSAASGAGQLGQAPGQSIYQGQLAQNELSSLPFQMMLQLMQATPISQPAYQPYSPSGLGSWLNLLGSFASSGAEAYAGRNG
jgi:hypothetical protein